MRAKRASGGRDGAIVSSDKDLMQLIEDGEIELFDPMKNKPLGPEAVMESSASTPDKVIEVQALIGDSDRQRARRAGHRPEDGGRTHRHIRIARCCCWSAPARSNSNKRRETIDPISPTRYGSRA